MAIRINNRTTLHQGRVYNLVTENVTLDSGVTTDVEFIQHPGATAIIPMIDPTHIILLNQYRHALRKYIWEIPAGTLDPGESVMSCAKRELIEETGYSAGQWQKLAEITPVPRSCFTSSRNGRLCSMWYSATLISSATSWSST